MPRRKKTRSDLVEEYLTAPHLLVFTSLLDRLKGPSMCGGAGEVVDPTNMPQYLNRRSRPPTVCRACLHVWRSLLSHTPRGWSPAMWFFKYHGITWPTEGETA